MSRIAVVHPPLGWGGSDAVALRTIEALKDDYDVCFVTTGTINLERLNRFHGTQLKPGEFEIIQARLPFAIDKIKSLAALRGRFLQRYYQQIASEFDLMISAYNPCAFGVPGIQLVADIDDLTEILPLGTWRRLWYGNTLLRKVYLKFCDLISSNDPQQWLGNLTLVNSEWTADLFREKFGAAASVIYPPVMSPNSFNQSDDRSQGFVCIGRIIPEKQIETIVGILAKVREIGHSVHLHIIGAHEKNDSYAQDLKSKIEHQHSEWVTFEGRVDEHRKQAIISAHNFGISARTNEPFGIAVAEMVKGGNIVFVPENGGQVEIVNHQDLVYHDVPDAVRKIDNVLDRPFGYGLLREHLMDESNKFSVETFRYDIRRAVSDFMKNR